MTKYGKIIIEANTIEEAEKDLAMIKALANAGAVSGQGSGMTGSVSVQMSVPSVAPSAPCCSKCGCGCSEDFNGTDDYEEDVYDEVDRLLDDFCLKASPTAQRMLDELLTIL